jgi:hypothetical protein
LGEHWFDGDEQAAQCGSERETRKQVFHRFRLWP